MVEKCKDCGKWVGLSTPIVASAHLNISVGTCSLIEAFPTAGFDKVCRGSSGYRVNLALRNDIDWCESFSTVACPSKFVPH